MSDAIIAAAEAIADCPEFGTPQGLIDDLVQAVAVKRAVNDMNTAVAFMNEKLGTLRPHAALDQAVIDAADGWYSGTAAGTRLASAVIARRAALAPPSPERKTWTVVTERRSARPNEQYLDSERDPHRVYYWPRTVIPSTAHHDVIVSVEPT